MNLRHTPLAIAISLFCVSAPQAQSLPATLDSPAAPGDSGSAMYTLEDLYNRVDSGAAGSKRSGGFVEPTSGPAAGGHTLDDVMAKAPASDPTNGADATQVLDGKTFWGLQSSTGWGNQSGTMANVGTQTITPGTAEQTITQGYHDGSGTVAGDADLSEANIKAGVELFGITGTAPIPSGDATAGQVLTGTTFSNASATGVSGTMTNVGTQTITPGTAEQTITQGYHDGSGTVDGDANLIEANIKAGATIFGISGQTEVVDTTEVANAVTEDDILSGKIGFVNGVKVTGSYPVAAVPKTGQTTCWDASGAVITCTDTGQDGDTPKGATQSGDRFTINGDGTVTDNQSGLIWLADANCPGGKTWTDALTFANSLYDGWTGDGAGGDCALTDGSSAGDWRLPNVKELQSLIDVAYVSPALSNTTGNGQWEEGAPFSGVQSSYYWSSTSYANNPNYAWFVNLNFGYVYNTNKADNYYVWPVRGGQ